MESAITFEVRAGYLYAEGQGPGDQGTMREALRTIKARADEAGLTRILINARRVERPRQGIDYFLLGEFFAELFGARYRIAALYPREFINKFAENTAVNRGANLFVTDEEAQAVEWLMK